MRIVRGVKPPVRTSKQRKAYEAELRREQEKALPDIEEFRASRQRGPNVIINVRDDDIFVGSPPTRAKCS
jgi:hypothetical protein